MFLKKNKIWLGLIVLVLVFVLLNVFQKEMRGFFYSFSAPIQKVFWRAGDSMSNFFLGIFLSGNLKERADQLEASNQKLLSQIVSLREYEQENQSLRKALGVELQKEFKLSLAQIISKDVSQDSILIDKGEKDNILKDMPVITEEKVLVGRVIDVYDKFSKVMLISNKNSSFDAKEPGSLISGVIKGMENGGLFFDLIPSEAEVNEGDIICTSSISGIYPEGLLVGKIKSIRKSDIESFQQAEIEPSFNLSSVENLFIITEF
ncbi:rod shape-determining protein MreC [Patescibacteria group bacterium]|nr:rod shape-determining protein MreC [Patescibacteria group bacterium]